MNDGNRTALPTPGGIRTELAGALPLETPYMIQIFPFYGCNLRCGFCIHALEREKHGFISNKAAMDLELYKKCVEDIKGFPGKLKMLRFAAIGEPLLHKDIAQMVRLAKEAQIAESLDIVTNGVLLTPELSDQLIAAGLTRLRISVEGLDGTGYAEHCGVQINFDRLVKNLAYFHEHAQASTEVYIKIIDYMVKEEEDQRRFYDIFSGICDTIAIEHLTPTVEEIDYGAVSGGMAADKPHNGDRLLHTEICPQPFYMMQINPDGHVVPCCSMKYPAILGHVGEETVTEIWRGKKYRDFQRRMLHSMRQAGPVCAKCRLCQYDLHEEDRLDGHRDRLMSLYGAR